MGCPAHMIVKEYHLYPEYKITETEAKSLKVHEIRQLKKTRHTEINKALVAATQLKFEKRFFISLPTKEAHEKVHPTGIVGGMAQRVHPMISKKIEDLVKEGITEVHEVKRSLRLFVKTDMRTNPPSESNRSYYPTNTDIRNHIDAAKAAIQLSKFDQISLKAMYEEWTKERKQGKYFFRPYIKKKTLPDTEAEAIPAQSPFPPASSTAQAVNGDSLTDHFTQTLMWKKQCCVERKCRNLVQLTKQPSDIPSSLRDTTACTSLQIKPGNFTNTVT